MLQASNQALAFVYKTIVNALLADARWRMQVWRRCWRAQTSTGGVCCRPASKRWPPLPKQQQPELPPCCHASPAW